MCAHRWIMDWMCTYTKADLGGGGGLGAERPQAMTAVANVQRLFGDFESPLYNEFNVCRRIRQ